MRWYGFGYIREADSRRLDDGETTRRIESLYLRLGWFKLLLKERLSYTRRIYKDNRTARYEKAKEKSNGR